MVCGAPLSYGGQPRRLACHYCGSVHSVQTACAAGHFVCDACHTADGTAAARQICLATDETDMIRLLQQIRAHHAVSVHGPEHHAMVPGIILATYRNRLRALRRQRGEEPGDGGVSDAMIETAMARGGRIPGGFCGFVGSCGAGLGVGAAFGVLLGSSPVKDELRQRVHQVTIRALSAIAARPAARCCQRDSATALRVAAELSHELLEVPLLAEAELRCEQWPQNRHCLGPDCPHHP